LSQLERVCDWNVAFGNPKGNPNKIDWARIQKQADNIPHELAELAEAVAAKDVDKTRDALADIIVFAGGGTHLMGYSPSNDLKVVIDALYSRFIKDTDDLVATLAFHKARGVEDVYTEGEFPLMILKSGSDQPDAPKGKVLKSASYKEPVFGPAPGN
jgi:hypothetical protein